MGQGLDVLKTCDGNQHRDDNEERHRNPNGRSDWDEDVSVGCDVLETGVKRVVASANRGGTKISDEVLINHELLQAARSGDVRSLTTALEKGAWTETRRPLVMKPQKPEKKGKGSSDDGNEADIGMTALMFSAQNGNTECVRRLIFANAEVNAIEEDGWSSLHFAAKEGNIDVCSVLIQHKADVQMINSEEKTPLDVAKEEDPYVATKIEQILKNGSS